MSNPENEKTSQMNESVHPGQQPDPMISAINPPPPIYGVSYSMPYQYQPPPPMYGASPSMPYQYQPPPPMYGTSPSMPYQYQLYAGPPGAIPMQSQQTIITNVQYVQEPIHLGYSIFTLLCCCFPLGIAALIYSIRTKEANRQGDIVSAKRYSRLALNLDHTALGVGIALIVLGIILIIVFKTVAVKKIESVHWSNFEYFNP